MKEEFSIEISTPYGRIILLNQQLENIDLTNTLIVISFNGDNNYSGNIASTASLENPISVMIDLSGNDIKSCNSFVVRKF